MCDREDSTLAACYFDAEVQLMRSRRLRHEELELTFFEDCKERRLAVGGIASSTLGEGSETYDASPTLPPTGFIAFSRGMGFRPLPPRL